MCGSQAERRKAEQERQRLEQEEAEDMCCSDQEAFCQSDLQPAALCQCQLSIVEGLCLKKHPAFILASG